MHLIKGSCVLVWYFSHASFYILFFSMNLVFIYAALLRLLIFTMALLMRYTLLWRYSFFDWSSRNLHSMCKIGNKRHFYSCMRTFWFSEYLSRELRIITKITSIAQLPYTSPLIPFGRTLTHSLRQVLPKNLQFF